MVHDCLAAASILAGEGVAGGVVDADRLPMEIAPVLALAPADGVILPVEDNDVGGLGSELAEAAASTERVPTVRTLVVRGMPRSGCSADDVMAYLHLRVAGIVAAVHDNLRHM